MNIRLKGFFKFFGIVFVAVLSLAVLFVPLVLFGFVFESIPTDFITSDINEYGNYPGVLPKAKDEYITSFFPDSIKPVFVNPTYRFSSRNIDTYGFEAYLEFTFDSQEQFEEHLEKSTKGMKKGTFFFDNDYLEYVMVNQDTGYVYDTISLSSNSFTDDSGMTHYRIDYADIAKILVNPKERRVIYIALAVFDGGGSDTRLLNSYFSRFEIDPIEYQQYTNSIG